MDKQNLRIHLIRKRSTLDAAYRKQSQQAINDLLQNFALQYRNVASFIPMKNEIDITITNNIILQQNGCILLPKMVQSQCIFVEVNTLEHLVPSKYGEFLESASNESAMPDLIIVPGLGYDPNKNRIGYGKGFYDKVLHMHAGITTIMPIFSALQVDIIPIETHDIAINFILTEHGII